MQLGGWQLTARAAFVRQPAPANLEARTWLSVCVADCLGTLQVRSLRFRHSQQRGPTAIILIMTQLPKRPEFYPSECFPLWVAESREFSSTTIECHLRGFLLLRKLPDPGRALLANCCCAHAEHPSLLPPLSPQAPRHGCRIPRANQASVPDAKL